MPFRLFQGLETLELRIKKHSENALELAKWLQDRKRSGMGELSRSANQSLLFVGQKNTFQTDQSGIVTFGVKGGFESAKKVVDETKLFSYWPI